MRSLRMAAVAVALLTCGGALARERTVTVQLGVGPSLVTFPILDAAAGGLGGNLFEDQAFHTGLRLSIAAIVDRKFVRENGDLVPRRYRHLFESGGEVRYVPWQAALVPRTLVLSPKLKHTGIYGASWMPLAVGLSPLRRPVRVTAALGAVVTYLFIHSDAPALAPTTHFLSVGGEIGLRIEWPLTRDFRLVLGWASALYLPQALGAPPLTAGDDPGRLVYHIGQFFLQAHFRFPVVVDI